MVRSRLGQKDDEVIFVSSESTENSIISKIPTINYEFKGKEHWEAEFMRRGDHVAEQCVELGLMGRTVPKPNPDEFFINYEYHLMHCTVFQAASTTWMYNMNLLAG